MVRDCLSGELGLTIMWQNPDNDPMHCIQDIDYTHLHFSNDVPAYSIIDHFVVSPQVYNVTREAGVIHSGDNPSNHSPIYIKLSVDMLDLQLEANTSQPRSSWEQATTDAKVEFKSNLAAKLRGLEMSTELIDCQDMHCKDHSDHLEEYTMNVLESMESACKESLPSVGGATSNKKGLFKPTPGWSEHVKPYQEQSKFWHSIWLSLGKPMLGNTYWNMIHTKNQYKYAVRRLKRAQDKVQNDKFVSSIMQGGVNIFQVIRKYRGVSSTFSSRIDSEVGAEDIANHFASIYSNLYNKTVVGDRLQGMAMALEDSIGSYSKYQINRVTDDLIREALKKMKSKKSDALFDTMSDFYIHGPDELVSHLAALIKLYLQHGCIPPFILLCTLLPIVKDNLGDATSSDNYRAIAGGCLLLKLLDTVILLLEGEKLGCDELQFGYQAESSTTMCSWCVTAVIDYFNRQGKPVYGCAMDMSKAFDMVDWSELFIALRGKNVEPIFLRLLLYIYRNQQCQVKWAGKFSFKFSVSNGVRQGAVSSAIFFSVYINELFGILRKAGLGCHILGTFIGCFGYADDILLLSASKSGLQSMVNLCQKFEIKKNLKFSTNENSDKSKTKCLVFSRSQKNRFNLPPVLLDGNPLPWVSKVKHLGNMLQCDNSMKIDLGQKRGKFIGKVLSLLQELSFVDSDVFVKLLNIYTTSFYGSSLWDIFSTDCERLYKSWNVTIRQVFGVDRCTHRYLIETISNSMHPKVMLSSRYVAFYRSISKSTKFPVRLLARFFKADKITVLGKTLETLCNMQAV